MASRFDNIQSRSIYVGASTNPDPALGNLIIDGSVGIGTNSPGAKLHVSAGDSSYALFGPNVAYGGSLRVGAGPATPSNTIAQVVASDGNLHLDSGTGQLTYINYYSETNTLINPNAGNVGIGSYNPIHKLTVGGNISISGGSGYLDFANGDIRFVNSGGLLSIQTYSVGTGLSTKMVVTGAGNVGIGTTSPDFNLTINGITGIQSSGTTKYHFSYYSGGLNFAQTGIADYRLFIQDGGNVGIGTSSPAYKLDVAGTISNNSSQNIIYSSYNAVAALFQRVGTYGSVIQIGRWGVSNSVTIDYPNDGTFAISTAGSERMRITSSGNVGIGTTNPSGHMLDIASTAGNVDNSAIRALFPAGGGLLSTEFGALAYRNGAWTAVYGKQGAAASAAYFDGKVGIGTSGPSYRLDVHTATAGDSIRLNNTNISVGSSNYFGYLISESGVDKVSLRYRRDNSGITELLGIGNAPFILGTNNTERLRIAANGTVLIGTTTAGVNGLLQVNGSIGLAQNTDVRQSTNSDGGTLRFLGTQFVAGITNSQSYNYGGGALMASVASSDNAVLLDVGRATSTDARFKITNTTSGNAVLSFGTSTVNTLYAVTNGNVGIGTSTPAAKLHVVGDIFGGSLFFSNANINSFGSAMTFTNNSAERMRISTTGNVGIGTAAPDASALLDITSRRQGFLPPRMSNSDMVAISSPAAGLVVYDVTNNKLTVYNGSTWVPLH